MAKSNFFDPVDKEIIRLIIKATKVKHAPINPIFPISLANPSNFI